MCPDGILTLGGRQLKYQMETTFELDTLKWVKNTWERVHEDTDWVWELVSVK